MFATEQTVTYLTSWKRLQGQKKGFVPTAREEKACPVMDKKADPYEPYQTIIIVEDSIDSLSVDTTVILANRQEPDRDQSVTSTLTPFPVAPPEDSKQHWQQPRQQRHDPNDGCGGRDALAADCAACASDVAFFVGRDRQLMLGTKSSLASVSDVFRAMFFGPWREYRQEIAVPDFSTRAFAVLLRHAAGEPRLPLDDDNVWEVLCMSDMYIVPSLVDICFHYLLHCHKSRKRSSHICQVLELSHVGCTGSNHARCMHVAKRRAGRIFQNKLAIRTLCYDCMLTLVKADDLIGADERQVHQAVVTWARGQCQAAMPNWKQLREAARDLVHHVRYLAMAPQTLAQLLDKPSDNCLLNEEEKHSLLRDGGGWAFPPDARQKLTAKRTAHPRMLAVCGEKLSWGCVGRMGFLVSLSFLVLFAVVSFIVYILLNASW